MVDPALEDVLLDISTVVATNGGLLATNRASDNPSNSLNCPPYDATYIKKSQFIKEQCLSQAFIPTNVGEEVLYNSVFFSRLVVISRNIGSGKRVYRSKKLRLFPATKSVLNHISIKLIDDLGHTLPPVEQPFRNTLFDGTASYLYRKRLHTFEQVLPTNCKFWDDPNSPTVVQIQRLRKPRRKRSAMPTKGKPMKKLYLTNSRTTETT
ncbi:unnamed protein product [Orchesella dallaii]|uniref:Uncharacterized protein n=1 Tax=Orchesella dallaii TaxID=48710 RepID=A0ABP1R1V0_9HEXA